MKPNPFPYRSGPELDIHAYRDVSVPIELALCQRAASRKSTLQWDPSQNGLFFEAPHRHSV
jgi:hypothetical protein